MNQKDSVKRRRSAIMLEAQKRGYEAVVFFNEVIRQNPSNTIYVMPSALGDEHQTFVMDADGETTLVMPHWGAPRVKASGEYNDVIAIKQEKGHHIKGTLEALKKYNIQKPFIQTVHGVLADEYIQSSKSYGYFNQESPLLK